MFYFDLLSTYKKSKHGGTSRVCIDWLVTDLKFLGNLPVCSARRTSENDVMRNFQGNAGEGQKEGSHLPWQ